MIKWPRSLNRACTLDPGAVLIHSSVSFTFILRCQVVIHSSSLCLSYNSDEVSLYVDFVSLFPGMFFWQLTSFMRVADMKQRLPVKNNSIYGCLLLVELAFSRLKESARTCTLQQSARIAYAVGEAANARSRFMLRLIISIAM